MFAAIAEQSSSDHAVSTPLAQVCHPAAVKQDSAAETHQLAPALHPPVDVACEEAEGEDCICSALPPNTFPPNTFLATCKEALSKPLTVPEDVAEASRPPAVMGCRTRCKVTLKWQMAASIRATGVAVVSP